MVFYDLGFGISFVWFLLVSGGVGSWIYRQAKRDLDWYQEYFSGSMDDSLDETGWRLLHAEVYRVPNFLPVFTVFLGLGIASFLGIILYVMYFVLESVVGVTNMTGFIFGLIYIALMGGISGFYTNKWWWYCTIVGGGNERLLSGKYKYAETILLMLLSAGGNLLIFVSLHLFVFRRTTYAEIFYVGLAEIVVFFIFPIFVFLGGWIQKKYVRRVEDVPENLMDACVRKTPRMIPSQRCTRTIFYGMFVVELIFFILLFSQYYFFMRMRNETTKIVATILMFLSWFGGCIEIGICWTYIQLQSENHRWYWHALIVSGGSVLFLFLSGVLRYFFAISEEYADTLITRKFDVYFGGAVYFMKLYMVCGIYALASGAVGFISAYSFVRWVYRRGRLGFYGD